MGKGGMGPTRGSENEKFDKTKQSDQIEESGLNEKIGT
jgi:hypothetical protein